VQTNGLPVVDPDIVVETYAQLANYVPTVNIAQVQLDALTKAQQVSAEVISTAIQIGAGMFI
jgi:hypothetical protein